MNNKNLLIGVCALALFAMTPAVSQAADLDAKAKSYTGAKTTVNNDLNSGVTTGDNVRINGGIRTGDNSATTSTDTSVTSDTSATVDGVGSSVSGAAGSVTGAASKVTNTLDSSVLTGDNVRINGGIRTGTNTSDTKVKSTVDSDTRATVTHDGDDTPGKSGQHRKDTKRKSWWHWGD